MEQSLVDDKPRAEAADAGTLGAPAPQLDFHKRVEMLRRGRSRVKELEGPKRWRQPPMRVRVFTRAVVFLSFLLVVFAGWSAFVVATGTPHRLLFDADKACEDTVFSCEVVSGLLLIALPLLLASALFLLWRFRRVPRRYVARAGDRPQDVVESAGNIIGDIVGREHLCDVIMEDLLDCDGRRPHVVVGGVGTGKTAVLVKLVSVLASRGAVPVPVRLRDATGRLDFRALARERFIAETQNELLSDAEGEKIWRRLCRDDQVVVLADGLEETLGAEAGGDRDTHIRLAISEARRERLPLVVASRPHDPLTGLDAAVVELEPLSEDAALQYIGGVSDADE